MYNINKQHRPTTGFISRLINITFLLLWIDQCYCATEVLFECVCLLFTSLSCMGNNFLPNRKGEQGKAYSDLAGQLRCCLEKTVIYVMNNRLAPYLDEKFNRGNQHNGFSMVYLLQASIVKITGRLFFCTLCVAAYR